MLLKIFCKEEEQLTPLSEENCHLEEVCNSGGVAVSKDLP